MLVACTGQSGLGKQGFLKEVAALVSAAGLESKVVSVGDEMYQADNSIGRGRILQLPLKRLNLLLYCPR